MTHRAKVLLHTRILQRKWLIVAKARSGLGRGLGSLLGGGPEGGFGQEPPSAPAPPAPAPVDKTQEEEMVSEEKPAPTVIEENVYTSKEDNVTIKSVVEREPAREAKDDSPKAEVDEAPSDSGAKFEEEVDIDLIEANPYQPRTNFKKEELEELAESIKKNGLLQPILVRETNGVYQIIAGERRWQACKLLGLKKVPVRIKEADDDETIILALIENIQRSDLNPIEEAYGYRRMMERGKMTQSEVAQAVSKGRTTITNALRLLELPEDAQQLLYEERITAGHARAILSIPTKEGRKKLTEKLMEEKLSVRDAEKIARQLSGKATKKPTIKVQAPKSYKTVARALSDSLGTEVKIKSAQGRNKIEVAFKDEADLERLFRLIAKNS